MAKRGPAKKEGLYPWEIKRAKRMLSAYVNDDMTLEEIGKYHGVTRERVRQIVTAFDPTLYKLAIRRRKGRTRLRRFVNNDRTASIGENQACPICGVIFVRTGRNQVYCTPAHHKLSVLLRYQINEEWRDVQRDAVARWTLKNGNEVQRRFARNHLARLTEESENSKAGTRYMQPGSLSFHWAIRAYVLEWPLFEKFCPEVQQQIKEYVGSATLNRV